MGVAVVASLGVALRSSMFSKEAHGAPIAHLAPSLVATTSAAFQPSWTFAPGGGTAATSLRHLVQHDATRRPMAWLASRAAGTSFESAGARVASDELRFQLAQKPGVAEGEERPESSFALRSLGLARGAALREFAHADATLANRHEVRIPRGEGVTESIRSIPRGYEQSWTFEHAPDGQGDLKMVVGLDPAFRVVRQTDDGIVLQDNAGARVSYGAASWVDANGARNDLRPTVEAGRVVINVPHEIVERSAYPAVLDPVVLDVASFTEAYAPSGAGDATTGNYLGCWEDYTTFATPRVYCRLYTPSTGTTVLAMRPSSGTSPQFEPVVERLSSGKFIVMWRDMRSGKSQIYYTTINATNGALYSADNRVTSSGAASTLDQYSPAVSCGVGNAVGSGSCLAVWGQINSNSVSEIYQSRYDFNTTTGVVSATYYQGTVEQAGNTPQAVDNYAPVVQLLDAADGAAFNAQIAWERGGSNTRIRSAFVGRFPSACQCTKDSVAVSGLSAGLVTGETGDQFYPNLTYVTDTGSAPRNHGLLTYVSQAAPPNGIREISIRSIEAFMGGGCTSVALPNSISAATQISSGGGNKDSVSRLACIAAGSGNACRVAYTVKNGTATSTVTSSITTSTTAPFFTVGGASTISSSAAATMFNARLASQITAGGNTGWLVMWDDVRATGYQTWASRINSSGSVLDGATGFKWSL